MYSPTKACQQQKTSSAASSLTPPDAHRSLMTRGRAFLLRKVWAVTLGLRGAVHCFWCAILLRALLLAPHDDAHDDRDNDDEDDDDDRGDGAAAETAAIGAGADDGDLRD